MPSTRPAESAQPLQDELDSLHVALEAARERVDGGDLTPIELARLGSLIASISQATARILVARRRLTAASERDAETLQSEAARILRLLGLS